MPKNKKIIFIVLAVVIVLIATWWFLGKPAVPYCKITNPLHCENDNDCVCVDAGNSQQGGCFLGNKNYYEKCADKSDVCLDFCTGWGQPPVKCINNKCTNDYKTGEVAITTDKAEYQTANEIKIIVANNKDREVIISSCPFGERFADVERKLDSGEYELIVLSRIDVICSGPYYLKRGRSHTYTWGEFISSTNTTDTIFNPPGTYRIKFGYLTDLPYTEENTRWIYSNEFEIKERDDQAETLIQDPYQYVWEKKEGSAGGIRRFFLDINNDAIPEIFIGTNMLFGNAGGPYHIFTPNKAGYKYLGEVGLHDKAFSLLDAGKKDYADIKAFWRLLGILTYTFDEKKEKYVAISQNSCEQENCQTFMEGNLATVELEISTSTNLQWHITNPIQLCMEEGRSFPGTASKAACCDGLSKIYNEYAYHYPHYGDDCDLMPTPRNFTCAYCGNGICGKGETKCNCPSDCQ